MFVIWNRTILVSLGFTVFCHAVFAYCNAQQSVEVEASNVLKDMAAVMESSRKGITQLNAIDSTFFSGLSEKELTRLAESSETLISVRAIWETFLRGSRSDSPASTGPGNRNWTQGYLEGRFHGKFPYESLKTLFDNSERSTGSSSMKDTIQLNDMSTLSFELNIKKCNMLCTNSNGSIRWDKTATIVPVLPAGFIDEEAVVSISAFEFQSHIVVFCRHKSMAMFIQLDPETGKISGCVPLPLK